MGCMNYHDRTDFNGMFLFTAIGIMDIRIGEFLKVNMQCIKYSFKEIIAKEAKP